MKVFVRFCISFLLTVVCVAAKSFPANSECNGILTSAGASSGFAGSVAHAVHSMTVADLKQFYPNATVVNYVPTVNKNLTADNAILLNAPDSGKESSPFLTEAMDTLDSILSKMDDKFWDIKNASPLEKLVHAFHMKEVWARALREFRIIEQDPSNITKNVCHCAMDIGNNGVMQIMKYLALVIREPSLVYGNPGYNGFNWKANIYKYTFQNKDSSSIVKLDNENGDTGMTHLENAESWKMFKHIVSREESYDAALFLYCSAKKSEKE